MKRPRWPRRTAKPLRIELGGIPAQLVPGTLRLEHHHTIERKPGPPPARMYLVVNDRAGYRYQGLEAMLNNPNGRVTLQLPRGAQIGIMNRESGVYMPLDCIDVEYTWDRGY